LNEKNGVYLGGKNLAKKLIHIWFRLLYQTKFGESSFHRRRPTARKQCDRSRR